MAEEQQKRRSMMPAGESSSSNSKMTKALSVSPSCPISSVVVKQEQKEGEVVHVQGGPRSRARAAMTEQTDPPGLQLQRINVSLDLQLLHCAVAECNRPLKPPVFKCEAAGHLLCSSCRGDGSEGHCRKCDRAATFVHCGPELDMYVGAIRVPCPFEAYGYGCDSFIPYHETADHRDACPYAPCRCSAAPGCRFAGSPPMLRDHLCDEHAWPVHKVPGYAKPVTLRVRASPESHRLLVVDGDACRLFVLSVRARGTASWAVSVACVRASAAAGPQYQCILWAFLPAPPVAPGRVERRLMMETDVASCATAPCGATVEQGMWLDVMPEMLHGPSREEMHLRIRINMLDPAPAAERSASANA